MGSNVLDYLDRSAAEHPGRCAVVDEHGSLDYRRLREASRRVGSGLAHAGARGRGVVVAMEKGARALVAQLGVLQAGGFYVPVDVNAPAERVERIVAALGDPLVVLDGAAGFDAPSAPEGAEVLDFAELARCAIDDRALAAARRSTLETDPAYALFTSGSTGMPKGVVISHRAIVAFIDAFVDELGISGDDRIGNQAPFDFDVSTKDIYSTLATGATLVIVPRRLFMRPAELARFLEEQRVTVLVWAVAALCLLSAYRALDAADLSSIRKVMFSGEIMPSKHLNAWRGRLPEAEFVNLYGPTEITCNCLYHVLDPACSYEEGMPLGKAFGHCEVLLVDERGRAVVDPGVEGELLVRGPSLALGYLNQPELTARAFCQNPLDGRRPDRVYRTGDVAVHDEEGRLFFRGRRDNQVKYQGHRIELEEIDLAFERMPGVDRCRCAFDDEKKLLRAFYEGSADERELPRLAREMLPAFMCPASIRRVSGMPLNKNGKVDRAQLLAMMPAHPARACDAAGAAGAAGERRTA